MDVRRLAAVDMHGLRGSRLRRRVILAEFALGAVGCTAVGLAALRSASPAPALDVFGAWLIGVGMNYVPLALYAIALSRPDALENELAGVDVPAELRTYTVKQFWVVVPGLFVVLAALQIAGRRQPSRT